MVMAEPSERRSLDLAAELGLDVEIEVQGRGDLDQLLLVAEQGQQLGDDGGPRPGRGGQLGGLGRAHAPLADRLQELGLELPLTLAELGLVALGRHGAGLDDHLALGLEPVDDPGDQGVAAQVGELGREVGPRDRRLPGPGRVQPAQGPQDPVLQVGDELGQDPHRPPRADRDLDQGPRGGQLVERRRDLVERQPGQGTQPALGPGLEPQERQRRGQPLERVGRAQPAQAGDRSLIAAAEPPRQGLEHASAAQRRRRALLAEHERLPVHGDHRLGQEELAELPRRPAPARWPRAGPAWPRPRRSPGGPGSGPGGGAAAAASVEPRRSRPRGRAVACRYPGAASSCPRPISPWWTPARLIAAREPRPIRSTGRSWRCRPRTRTALPAGCHSRSSPTATAPEATVPVTTVPCPATVNDRSIAIRNSPGSCRTVTPLAQPLRARASASSMPSPVTAEVRTIAAPSRNVPRTSSRISSSTRPIQRRLGQVALGQDDQAAGEPEQAEDLQVLAGLRHHRVVGRDDQHRQVQPRRPGQHVADEPLVPRHVDQGQVVGPQRRATANPRSIVIPRCFSAGSRSVSTPVKARTRAVLPWSICPAVPRTRSRSPACHRCLARSWPSRVRLVKKPV